MSRIFWDTHLFLDLISNAGKAGEQAAALRTRMIEREDELLTSALTLGEVLANAIRLNDEHLAQKCEQAISASAFVISFDSKCAPEFARLRATEPIDTRQAVQLACAASAATDLFITDDAGLLGLTVPGIEFIQPPHSCFI